jgi:hypothetical protein
MQASKKVEIKSQGDEKEKRNKMTYGKDLIWKGKGGKGRIERGKKTRKKKVQVGRVFKG